MKSNRIYGLLAFLPIFALAWVGSPAQAGVFTLGCASQSACTLDELINGGSITAGGTRFDSWEIERDPGTVDFKQVVVEGLGDGGLDPGPGLRIQGNGQIGIVGSDELDLRFGFKARSIYPNFRIRDNRLELPASATAGSGRIAIDENVFDGSLRFLAWKDVRVDPAFGELRTIDSAQFGNQTSLLIEKDLLLEGSGANDRAEVRTVIQRFSQTTVPEPGIGLGLFSAVSLLGLLAARRRPSQLLVHHDSNGRPQARP